MRYPNINEYICAIKNPKNYSSDINDLTPVTDQDSNPVFIKGRFSLIFKMRNIDNNKNYALKCFLMEEEGRDAAYNSISKITRTNSKYLVEAKYYTEGLFCSTEGSEHHVFPVVVMEWVEGTELDTYVNQFRGNPFVLNDLCIAFTEMAKWLSSMSFAHGDINPDNIIVKATGDLILVDYDDMFTEAMCGKKITKNKVHQTTNLNHIAIRFLIALSLAASRSHPQVPRQYLQSYFATRQHTCFSCRCFF